MKAKVAFYQCGICGNMVGLIKDGGGQLVCCGQPMNKLEANTVDASREKHVPVAVRKDGKIYVDVGSVLHPMTKEHYIEWIAVVSDDGTERISLAPGNEPKAVFCDRKNAEVYAYCNLHGLWKSVIE
ncbi:MAG TPA: desulfoferrodoxin [Clostridiaceae bacterium]|jgi:superoxide reductase|nr:desulfoferrodoxin [Clostridiaceae bacterium]